MARSKNGGTRAYIRGRIGSDVYSVGKNSKGEKQQVVRSLAETVANPRTSSQMFGRMVMSTVMQAVSALKPIIDHSFDGVPTGQPSISEFIRRNYALVKADAIANPSAGNTFGLAKYQEKGAKGGRYIVSNGDVIKPKAVTFDDTSIAIQLTAATLTVGGLKAALGLSADGYLTWVCIGSNKAGNFLRAKVETTLADETALTQENIASIFSVESNFKYEIALSENKVMLYGDESWAANSYGGIVSEKIDGVWKHSTCILNGDTPQVYTADVALPTYPTGSAMFLNGGDI